MPDLTPQQRRAIEQLDRPMTLIAAAGSGKTTVLVGRYLALLERGAKPGQILTVTFTTEAARQLRHRIRARLEAEGASSEKLSAVETTPYIGTIHSFCYSLLDGYGSYLGLPPIAGIVDEFELAATFGAVYDGWLESLPEAELRELLAYYAHGELRDLAHSLFSHRHAFRRSLAHLKDSSPADEPKLVRLVADRLSPLFARLEERLLARGRYTFDDLESLALQILERAPEVATRLREQIRFVLVDEFQDTSRLQWEILRPIVGEETEKLFVVGDPKQSIYSFRDADVKLFLELGRELESRGGHTEELSRNFRSSPELLVGINRIAEAIFRGAEVPFSLMESGRETPEPALPLSQPPLALRRYEAAGRHDLVRVEPEAVATFVHSLVNAGARPSQIALLFRVSDRIPDYFQRLARRGVPVVCRKTSSLFRRYDVLDVVHYLQTVHNPLDDFALAAFLRSPYVGFTDEALWKAVSLPGESLFEKLFATSDPALGWLFAHIESGDSSVSGALRALFEHTRHWPETSEALLALLVPLTSEPLTVHEAVRRVASWEREEISFQTESREGGSDAVKLMTVHAAKGLEFEHVLLVDNLRAMPRRGPAVRLDPGLPPGLRFRRDGEMVTNAPYRTLEERRALGDIEESRRILYVALTRAMRSLTVFLPQDASLIPKGSWGDWLNRAAVGL